MTPELSDSSVTAIEQIKAEYGLSVPTERIRRLANFIWRLNGSVENDPRTLNNWLEAEAQLLAYPQ